MRTLLCIWLLLVASTALAQSNPLELTAVGEPRVLPARILGASAEPFWDNFVDHMTKLAALRSLHLGFVRFPGGSQSNYYDWKSGLFTVEPGQDNADYYSRFVTLSQGVKRKNPRGISSSNTSLRRRDRRRGRAGPQLRNRLDRRSGGLVCPPRQGRSRSAIHRVGP